MKGVILESKLVHRSEVENSMSEFKAYMGIVDPDPEEPEENDTEGSEASGGSEGEGE